VEINIMGAVPYVLASWIISYV